MNHSELNGWSEWGKHVIEELKRLDKGFETLNTKMDERHIEVINKVSTIELSLVNNINAGEKRLNEKINLSEKKIARLEVKAAGWGAIGAVCLLLLKYLIGQL